MKQCDACHAHCAVACRECPECGALFLSLDGKPSNIAWRKDMKINVDGTYGPQYKQVRWLDLVVRQTLGGKDMLLVNINFKDGNTQYCAYFPGARGGSAKWQFELLHKLLRIDAAIPLPDCAASAKQYLDSSKWRQPKSIVLARDDRQYVYISAVA